ncbi:MAG: 23S rRNA (uracil(1939)-C(5))-methyltransferase RlmD [Ruminococcus sp.]|nr:23S rRNA (uracil(1939)-C(5))-methyltransferase RlmD [Ruminococcus sp.]
MKDFCIYAKKCNSCQLCNLSYAEQLHYKENICRRFPGKLCPVEPITPSPKTEGYRNKAQFVFRREGKRIVSGLYKSTTRSVMPADRCAVCSDNANAIIAALCKLFQSFKVMPYDPYTGRGWLKSVVIREAAAAGESMAVINGADAVFPAKRTFAAALQKACPTLTTAVCTVNRDPTKLFTGKQSEILFGKGFITDVLCGERFILSPASFYQINHDQTERLYAKAVELAGLSGSEIVLDAYCGVGTIGIIASRRAGFVHAVELNPAAVADAKRSAKLNGIENIRFTAADSRDFAKTLAKNGAHIDAAFIDPPRAGCTASFLNALSKLKPDRIVYISCNPETQARDMRLLIRMGYTAQVCCPFDMFPHTNHTESVVLLRRNNNEDSEIFQPKETTSETIVLLSD